jgi:hypothetical protein
MDHTNNSGDSCKRMKYKFKYLGMKWRFLKFDLEKEALPPVPKGDQTSLDNQSILERSVIFETYEKGFNFSDQPQQQSSVVGISSYLEDSFGSLNQFPTSELENSVFTEEDLMRGIRNVQIFQSLEPIKPTPPSTGQQQLGPSKPMVFSPRPPGECKSTASITPKLPNHRSPRLLKNQKVKNTTAPLKDQIQKLDISKSFKM